MAAPDMPFTEEDVSTWTHKRVKLHVESSKNKLKAFYTIFFGWSEQEYKEAKDHTVDELRKHFDLAKKFPTTGPQAKLRYTMQTNLVRDWPELFVDRHGQNPPAWFDVDLISRPPSNKESFNMKNVVQQFISHTRNFSRNHFAKLKRKHHAEYDEDDDDDDDENNRDNSGRNKQPQVSRYDRTTPHPIDLSMSIPPGLPTGVPMFQASGSRKPLGRSYNHRENDSLPIVATTSSVHGMRPDGSSNLILYITRVTINEQTLTLERDRFAFVDNLFEKGQLFEPRIHEFIFGNPLDNKSTFLWYFDGTSDDTPRSIRNRPSAEEVSFELEIDNNDEDENDVEEAEEASRMDSAYESRDEKIQIDDVAVKEEVDSKLNITWTGQEQHDNNVESDSESEED
ncbi:hypothetical protein M436DRAFT_62406 [Aureobasidium namibiae CBS 147.97]|uniref:Uncharacterized protein n=1 Tax=Aureobasidium namibiae CBS 147.97 TaxID=1043004 RepID=A0A074XKB5_9PEZI